MFAAIGIVMALLESKSSGQGQFVDVGMVDGVLATCERIVNQYSYTGLVPRPEGNRHPLLCPSGVVAAADGWLTLSDPTDELWRKLATLLASPDHGNDARYATVAERLKSQDEAYQTIEAFPQPKTKSETG